MTGPAMWAGAWKRSRLIISEAEVPERGKSQYMGNMRLVESRTLPTCSSTTQIVQYSVGQLTILGL